MISRTISLCCSLLVLLTACGPTPGEPEAPSAPAADTGAFDAALAEELGADDYGMRRYVIAFLKAGPVRSQDSTTAANLQRAHLDNIMRLAEEGKLVVAGPFMDDGEVRGIYIFAVETVAEAEALTASDPSVKAGRLVMELHPWYGPAALLKVNEWSRRISKESI